MLQRFIALIKRNPSSTIGTVLAAITLATPYIAELQDATAPFGVPDVIWYAVGVAFAATTVILQHYQQTFDYLQSVSWGWQSLGGIVVGLALMAQSLLGDLTTVLVPAGVPSSVFLIGGSVVVLLTKIGRTLQAVAPARANRAGVPPLEAVPTIGGAGEPSG